MTDDGLTVGAVAAGVGVTVRTLHHWDAIGLVRPSGRTVSGYRLYSAADIARIHRVLIYRELGLPLKTIGELLDAATFDATASSRSLRERSLRERSLRERSLRERSLRERSLREQRRRLLEHISRLQGMVAAVDRMIEAASSGILLSAQEQVALFGERWQPSWVADARDRWGDTAQWAQYAERAAGRSPEDWKRIAKGAAALEDDLAAAKRAGVVPGSAEANALAERHRASIGVYFDCSVSMHVCLGRMYAADPSFAAYHDAIEPGLSGWLREVIDAHARARGIDPESATWG